jgi:ATP-dependent Clp protease ATP-binding subunit ClpA
MFEKFTQNARMSIYYAREEALKLGAESVTPEHLLLGMLDVAPEQINKLAVPDGDCVASIRNKLMSELNHGDPITGTPRLSPDTKQVLQCAHENAYRLKQWNIDVCHLLLGILSYNEEVLKSKGQSLLAGRVLTENGFDKEIVQKRILAVDEI